MDKKLKDIFSRGVFLYLIALALLSIAIDQRQLAFRTMNFLNKAPGTLIDFVQKNPVYDASDKEQNSNDLRGPLRYFQNLSKVYPKAGVVLSTLGYCAFYMGDYPQAVKYYKQAINEEPDNFALYYNLGTVYFYAGNFLESVEVFKQGLQCPFTKVIMNPRVIIPDMEMYLKTEQNVLEARIKAVKATVEQATRFVAAAEPVVTEHRPIDPAMFEYKPLYFFVFDRQDL